MQLNHYNSIFSQHKFPITIVCENVTNAPNLGSLFRAADAFGVEQIIFCGTHIPLGRKIVNFKIADNASETIETLKNNGYQIIALEITSTSLPIHELKFSTKQPIALVIGDENFGVSENILKTSDLIVHINMFGQNSSMNVVQATSIALYEMTKQLV